MSVNIYPIEIVIIEMGFSIKESLNLIINIETNWMPNARTPVKTYLRNRKNWPKWTKNMMKISRDSQKCRLELTYWKSSIREWIEEWRRSIRKYRSRGVNMIEPREVSRYRRMHWGRLIRSMRIHLVMSKWVSIRRITSTRLSSIQFTK